VGVHCGIYKSSYNISNISYLNSPSPPFSFIPSSSHSWNSFMSFWVYFSKELTSLCLNFLLFFCVNCVIMRLTCWSARDIHESHWNFISDSGIILGSMIASDYSFYSLLLMMVVSTFVGIENKNTQGSILFSDTFLAHTLFMFDIIYTLFLMGRWW
jgi:hypothetical protein